MTEKDIHELLMAIATGGAEGLIVMWAMYYGGKSLIELYFEKRRVMYAELETRFVREEEDNG